MTSMKTPHTLFLVTLSFVIPVISRECSNTEMTAAKPRTDMHFLEPFRHVEGSACCNAVRINAEPVTSAESCCGRCMATGECQAWVMQPSSGQCWLLQQQQSTSVESDSPFVLAPAKDRVAGLRPSEGFEEDTTADRGNEGLRMAFKGREEIAGLLSYQQPRGMGALLGVGRGDFALQLLKGWPDSGGLYLIDPYIHVWKGYTDPENLSDKQHQMVFENLRTMLRTDWEWKHSFLRDFSFSMAKFWVKKDWPKPTFIYIDNNHAYHMVKEDLRGWWPILAGGGLMGGSFFADVSAEDRPSQPIGVKSAVVEFFEGLGLQDDLFYSDTKTGDPFPNWWIFKPVNHTASVSEVS